MDVINIKTRALLCAVLPLFWILGTPSILAAEGSQVVPSEPPATLEEYLRRGQVANPQLKAFEQRYEAAMQRIPQASSLPDPMLQVTSFVESVLTRSGPQENVLMLSQKLPWFGKLSRRKDMASAEAEALWYAYSTLTPRRLAPPKSKFLSATTFLSCIRSFHEIPRRPSSKKQFPRISQSAPKIPCTVAAFMANPGNSPIQLVDRHYVFAIGHRCLRQQKFS